MGPDISFADALRAAEALGPLDTAARDAVLEALGITRRTVPAPAPSAIGVWQPSSTEVATRPASPPVNIEPHVNGAAAGSAAVGRREQTAAHDRDRGSARAGDGRAALLAAGARRGARTRPLHQPRGPRPRGCSSRYRNAPSSTAALSTVIFEGDLDVDGIVEVLASGLVR